ncbi:hypothetical protein ACEPPN_015328 [Leptodophora sp. 'Broadleaf-Isolate-01']
MGKKKTPGEKAKRARENGFNDDDDDIDDSLILKIILEYTDGVYKEQMEMWREFAKDRPGANPCHFRTLKHFAEFVGLSIPGQLEEMPTVDTYIKGPLQVKIGLSTAHRERHYLTLKKYLILVFAV